MIWLMTRGELPTTAQARCSRRRWCRRWTTVRRRRSIAIARMAATCGVGLNNAMASAVNVLGDVHGGAGEQAVEFYQDIAARIDAGAVEADCGASRAG